MLRYGRPVGVFLYVMTMLAFSLAPLVPLVGQEKKPVKAHKHFEVSLAAKMKLVYIEPGKFMMGSPKEEVGRREGPNNSEKHRDVEIPKGFWMGVYEVTHEEFGQVMGKNPSHFKGKRLPVEQVSVEDALDFCKRVSKNEGKTFDLPTEAEWEYACRAGSKGPFHFGNALSSKQARFNGTFPYGEAERGDYLSGTAVVGSFEPNAVGLYDMHGNVGEWCKDSYTEGPNLARQGYQTYNIVRGGSWNCTGANCRSAMRGALPPDSRSYCTGFRVVMRP